MSEIKTALTLLMPEGPIWEPRVGSDYDLLIEGVADFFEQVFEDVDGLRYLRDPDKTPWPRILEQEFGITANVTLTDEQRRGILKAAQFAVSRYGDDWSIQDALNKAGFTNLTVYHNDPASDPNDIMSETYSMVAVGRFAYVGGFDSEAGSHMEGEWVVNPVDVQNTVKGTSRAGKAQMVAGGPIAISGYHVVLQTPDDIQIPSAPSASQVLTNGDFHDTSLADWDAGSGGNVLPDGDFSEVGTDEWEIPMGYDITTEMEKVSINPYGTLKQCMRITRSDEASALGARVQSFLNVPWTGKYNVRGVFRGDGIVGIPRIRFGPVISDGTILNEWQEFELLNLTLASGTAIIMDVPRTTSGAFAEFGYIEISPVITELSVVADPDTDPAHPLCLKVSAPSPYFPTELVRNPSALYDTVEKYYGGSPLSKTGFRVVGFAKGSIGGAKPVILSDDTVQWEGVGDGSWEAFDVSFRDATGLINLSMDSITGSVYYDNIVISISETPWRWEQVFFIGGAATRDSGGRITSIAVVEIPENKRMALREIILRFKPVTTFCGLRVSFVSSEGADVGYGYFPFGISAFGL